MTHLRKYIPRPMSQQPDLAGAPGLLRALATDVEQPGSGYAFASVTAEQLRNIADYLDGTKHVPGIGEMDRLDAIAMMRELVQRMEKTPSPTGDSLAFVSAGNEFQSTTIKVSPRVAALVMQLLESVRREASSSNVA